MYSEDTGKVNDFEQKERKRLVFEQKLVDFRVLGGTEE